MIMAVDGLSLAQHYETGTVFHDGCACCNFLVCICLAYAFMDFSIILRGMCCVLVFGTPWIGFFRRYSNIPIMGIGKTPSGMVVD